MHKFAWTALSLAMAVALSACSGGSNSSDPTGTAPPPPEAPRGCEGSCVNAQSFLTAADVQTIVAQAVAEASARNAKATVAVVDRVGNVLGVYQMTGAGITVRVGTQRGVTGGLEGLNVPRELAAVSKAITGAYLSSEGNAFSTRTASQIVQEHFNPGEFNAPSGPLFGVQFSQLSCSDFVTRFGGGIGPGPHRSPLGLSADPGGLPLYKAGVPVGGIGVAADDDYTLDPTISDLDRDLDELIATAGSFGFAPPNDRRGDQITADGKTFRFNDASFSVLSAAPGTTATLGGSAGSFMVVPGYSDGTVRDGTVFGSPASGIRPDADHYPGRDAFVLVDETGALRYPPRSSNDGSGGITAEEARVIVDEALGIANRARAQIRQPFGTQARVSITVVDRNGEILAFARTRDAPIFGADVSVQKARTAAFYSSANAAGDLQGLTDVTYFSTTVLRDGSGTPTGIDVGTVGSPVVMGDYVSAVRAFIGSDTALADGAFAFSDRAGGNLSRPFYPDGIISDQNGPFAYPYDQWSPFHDGIQLDLVYSQLAFHVVNYINQRNIPVTLGGNALVVDDPMPGTCTTGRIRNGIQIFPGSVPIYRGEQLVGGIGISGDGVDQDDMISFLGTHNAGIRLNTGIGNAPPARRADQLVVKGARLRFVQCPQAPFIGSDEQNVCGGK